jgi:predicted phage terminase large subunit-like protein
MQQEPAPADGETFKAWWWQRYVALPKLVSLELCLDSAFKDGVGNDWSVFALWGSDGRGSSYLVNLWREKLQYPDLMRLAHTAYAWAKAQFPGVYVSLVIEDKASGQSAIQTLKHPYPTMDGTILPALPVLPFPVKASESKTARAEGVTPIIEGGRAFIPASAPWLDDWLDEHQKFPNGKHDDQVDTTVMGVSRTQRPKGGLA